MRNVIKALLVVSIIQLGTLSCQTCYGQTSKPSSSFSVREAKREGLSEELSDRLEGISESSVSILDNLDRRLAISDSINSIAKESCLDRMKSLNLTEAERIRLENKLLDLERERVKTETSLKTDYLVAKLDYMNDKADIAERYLLMVRPETISDKKDLRDLLAHLESFKKRNTIFKGAAHGITVDNSVMELMQRIDKSIDDILKISEDWALKSNK